MPSLPVIPTPKQLHQAYEEGLEGWIWDLAAERDWNEFQGEQRDPIEALADLKGSHKDVPRALLYRSREKYDKGAQGEEKQAGPDCTSHGDRYAYDVTRSVEIDVKKEPEEYKLRSCTEFGYGMRGSRGGGSSPAVLARAKRDYGTLFRQKYPELGLDLSRYTYSIGANWGGRGVPSTVKEEAKKHPVGELLIPKDIEQALDLFANGYACHSGQQWACSSSQPADGINRKRGTWNHDMGSGGYDLSKEIWKEEVVFVAQSWGEWCPPNKIWLANQDVLGPYPTGMIVCPLDEWERYFLKSGSIYFYGNITGFPAQRLPNYGTQSVIA